MWAEDNSFFSQVWCHTQRASWEFCETCQGLICRDCVVHHHTGHNCKFVSDLLAKYRQDMKAILVEVLSKICALEDALSAIKAREEAIREQAQHISVSAQQTGPGDLVGEVNRLAAKKLWLIDQQKKGAEAALVQLKSTETFVEKDLELSNPQHILSEKKNLIEGTVAVIAQIDPDMFQPVEEASITFSEAEMAVFSSTGRLIILKFFCHVHVSCDMNVT